PSDEAAALDDAAWSHFVVRGVRTVEDAPDAAALQSRLAALFAPIAPTAAIFLEGSPAPAIAAPPSPAIHWIHHGVGISKQSPYHSVRATGESTGHTTIVTEVDTALVRGKELKATLRAHGALTGERADAGLWIAEQKADGKRGFYTEPEAQPAVGAS